MSGARDHEVDVLVVGGGITGTIAALAFCREGFTTALLDDHPASMPDGDYRQRVSSFNLASQNTLERLEVWPLIAGGRISPVERIETWDAGSSESLVFDAADAGLPHLAHILENELVAGATREVLETHPRFHPLARARLMEMELHADTAVVRADDGSRTACRLVVGADGADSTIRRFAGIDRSTFDYRQQAVVARVRPAHPHMRTARQKFLQSGPLAFLPLADDSCSIVWSLDETLAARVLRMDDATFREHLDQAFDGRAGRIESTGPRAAFPLRRTHATRYTAERVALIGDACHTVHPLAGLGANQGIADAMALVQATGRARAAGQRFWHDRTLARYQRSRRPGNTRILATMDLFHLGFTNELPLLPEVRRAAFSLVNHAAPARRFFIRQATGMAP